MSWSEALPATLSALAIMILPGALMAALLGLRAATVAGLAAPISITMIGFSGLVSGATGSHFDPLLLSAVTLLGAIASVTVRYGIHRGRGPLHPAVPFSRYIFHAVGLGIAVTLIGLRLVFIIGRPDDISQTYDNNFHLNAIKYILDSGNGSSLSLGGLGAAPGSFYPGAWHDAAALVAQLSSSNIPVSVTACTLILGAVVWPLSCIFLVTAVVGYRPLALLMTGVLSAGFGAFPYLMIDFGVLYPYFMALTVLPVALALIGNAFGFVGGSKAASALLLTFLVLPGIGLAHPSVVLHVLAVGGLLILLKLIHAVGHALGRLDWIAVALWAAGSFGYLFLLSQLWEKTRPSRQASFWPPHLTSAQAIGEVLTVAPMSAPVAWFIGLLLSVGIAVAFMKPNRSWVFFQLALTGFLYVVVSSWPKGDDRYFITGIWYNDANRLAGALPAFVLPVAIMGLCWLVDKCLATARTSEHHSVRKIVHRVSSNTWGRMSVLLLSVFLAIGASQGDAVLAAQKRAHLNYIISDDSALISIDEMTLLSELDELVPEDAVILGNPWTGAGLSYALGDRAALVPHVNQIDGPTEQTIVDHLDESASNAAVCDAVSEVGELYVLDFRSPEVHKEDHGYAGMNNISQSTGFTLVKSVGDAHLYRFTGCLP